MRGELLIRRVRKRRKRLDPERAQALRGLRPDARDERAPRGSEPLARLFARKHDEAARLLGIRSHLGHELVGTDPDRAAEARRSFDVRPEATHRGVRSREPGEVEVGLVEPDDLDRVYQPPDACHHLSRRLAVVREVGREEHALRAQAPGPRRRHCRADAEPPRLVRGRGDDRARSGAGDDHRTAAQLRPAPQLDGHVERIHVEVGDAPVRHRSQARTRLRREARRPFDGGPTIAGVTGWTRPGRRRRTRAPPRCSG